MSAEAAEQPNAPAADPSQPAPQAPAEGDNAAPQGEGAEQPKAAPSEADIRKQIEAEFQQKMNRVWGDRTQMERAQVEKDRKIQELQKRFDGVDPDRYRQLEKYTKDPAQMVRDGVLTADQLTELAKGYASGELEATTEAERQVQKALQEVEELRGKLTERERLEQEREQQQVFQQDVQRLQSLLEDEESGYPILRELGAAEGITRQIYDFMEQQRQSGGQAKPPTVEDVHQLLQQRQDAVVGDMLKCLRTPVGVSAIQKDGDLKAQLLKALTGEGGEANETSETAPQETSEGATKPTGDGARTVTTDAIAQAPSRATGAASGKGRGARKAAAAEALRRALERRKERTG